jgi:hypothetical protein
MACNSAVYYYEPFALLDALTTLARPEAKEASSAVRSFKPR